MLRAVIFDFDGTLVDFVETDITALEYVYSLSEPTCTVKEFVDASIEGILLFHQLVDRSAADPLQMFQYRLLHAFRKFGILWDESYTEHYKAILVQGTTAYSGVADLLHLLRKRVVLGLLTNAYDGILQRKRIEISGLSPLFDEIVVAGETAFSKPDPKIFLLMCRKLGVSPNECLFVGDSLIYDIEGAHSAGMKTLLLGEIKDSAAVDYSACTIPELAQLLEELLIKQ